jgi:hypothetical protein
VKESWTKEMTSICFLGELAQVIADAGNPVFDMTPAIKNKEKLVKAFAEKDNATINKCVNKHKKSLSE